MSRKKISIKPSPVIIVKRLIVIEVLVAIIVVLIFFFVDILALYNRIPINDSIAPTTAAIIVIVVLQIVFLVSTFLTWFFDTYEITKEKIVHKKGVIFKKKSMIKIDGLSTITQTQGFLGKWLNYASIELIDDSEGILIIIPDVFKPKEEIENIEDLLNFTSEEPPKIANLNLHDIIRKGESKKLEFKSSFRWDYKKGAVNKEMEYIIAKSISAFMNSEGGRLLIGVDDKGEIVGLENDLKSLKKKDKDGFENHLTTTFSSLVGPEFTQYYTVSFDQYENKVVCVVDVVKSNEPAYFKSNGDEKFFVRAGNSTRELNVRESFTYIRTNFEEFSG